MELENQIKMLKKGYDHFQELSREFENRFELCKREVIALRKQIELRQEKMAQLRKENAELQRQLDIVTSRNNVLEKALRQQHKMF